MTSVPFVQVKDNRLAAALRKVQMNDRILKCFRNRPRQFAEEYRQKGDNHPSYTMSNLTVRSEKLLDFLRPILPEHRNAAFVSSTRKNAFGEDVFNVNLSPFRIHD